MNRRTETYDIVHIGIFTVLLVFCSWISIPTAIPFTMQTFGVFTAMGLLGGKRGTICILVYLILGAVGLPVFSGFSGGFGVLMGNRGGYIFGFLLSALLMWIMEMFFGKRPGIQILSMVLGLIACYACGTLWFLKFYMNSGEPMGLAAVLGWCVIPFVIPDILKIMLSYAVCRRVRKFMI